MKVYLLIFSVGIENGFEELVGIYDSEETLNAAKESHNAKQSRLSGVYYVEEVNLNQELNFDLASW